MGKRLNILITNVDAQPQYIGGIKRVSMTLADRWISQGHKVSFLAYCPCETRYNTLGESPQYFLPGMGSIEDDNLAFMSELIDQGGYDIILNQHIEDLWISNLCFKIRKAKNIRLISAYHFAPTYLIDEKDAWHDKAPVATGSKQTISRLYWLLKGKSELRTNLSAWFKKAIDASDAFVLLSDKFIPSLEKLIGRKDNSIKAINNPSIFEPLHNPAKDNTVVWCGRLGTGFKRTDLMLKIWGLVQKEHPDWQCVIMGSGDVDYWRQIAIEMGLQNVTFTGFCNPEEYYSRAKIFCMTSVTEGWGLVLIESMAKGCVPMAFDSFGSVHDIISDGVDGILVKPFDISLYATKLAALMDDEDLRAKMSAKTYDKITKYNPDVISRQWIDLFNDVTRR